MSWAIHNHQGQRKYLTSDEVDSFVRSARKYSIEVRSFCWMLAYSGCRISEALSLTRENIDFEAGHVIIRCLKKRGKRVFRAIPLPPHYLKALHRLCQVCRHATDLLWPWSRMTGYRRICEVMQAAGIRGSYASPKGLRHAFGVRAIQASVPLNLVQRWLGHADIKTTAIYTNVMGPEEQEIAARMWQSKAMWTARSQERREAHEANMRADLTVTLESDWDDLPSHTGAAGPETRHIASVGGRAPVRGFIAHGARSGQLPGESCIKRILYCPLIQYWI